MALKKSPIQVCDSNFFSNKFFEYKMIIFFIIIDYHLYQYYLKVVLTNVQTFSYEGETYQYSVTERDLIVNHEAGLHGVPGIYFKYEIEGLKIDVLENSIPIWKFLVRLCAIVGGIIELSIMFNQLFTNWIDIIDLKYRKHRVIHFQ